MPISIEASMEINKVCLNHPTKVDIQAMMKMVMPIMQQKLLPPEILMEALINLIIKAMPPKKASMNNKLPLKLLLRSMSKEVS